MDLSHLKPTLASVQWLQPRLVKFFRSRKSVPVFMTEGLAPLWPSQGPVDVILFGDFLRHFNKKERWFPHSRGYRLWALSSRHQKSFCEALNLSTDKIGVIPREIFGRKKKQRELDLSRPVTFIYAGRLSADKNVLKAIQWAKKLCRKKNIPFSFRIFSQDARFPERLKRFKGIQIEENSEWIHSRIKNPVLINFSSSLTEDFGVSVRMARLAGWPIITSDWGGLADETGSGTWRITKSGSLIPADKKIFNFREPKVISHSLLMRSLNGKGLSEKRQTQILEGK